jgi:hypothetical protein
MARGWFGERRRHRIAALKGHRRRKGGEDEDLYPELEEAWRRLWVERLEEILCKARISGDLRRAVGATIDALKEGDYELAYELTSVKSLIVGGMDAGSPFREDDEYNRRTLGGSVYGMLDEIHHGLALKINRIPSGAVIVTAEGWYEKEGPRGRYRAHPVLRLIEEERQRISRA